MNELKAIAEINQEVKSIVHIAENISLTATNAILLANQAGVSAVGFSVVARELRRFSEKMAIAMHGLSGQIYRQVEATATKRRMAHNLNLLNMAGVSGGLAQTRIAPACAHNRANADDMDKFIDNQVHGFQATMTCIQRQCAGGLVIARSAGIEAAYGGSMAETLHMISLDVTEVTDTIFMRVKQLDSRLKEAVA